MDNNPEAKEQKRIGTFMVVLMWILLLAFLISFFEDVIDRQINPNQSLNTQYTETGVREVELQRNRYGHYVTDGSINGQPVVFMLDTGATGVAVPQHIAKDLQLEPGMAIQVQTANGLATGYDSVLDRVAVDGIELKNIRAIINPNDDTDVILLGMSFLKKIEFTQRGDVLILRQYTQK
ncbi:MAG: TIGR02281 family clan AA aspartic protease [Gammaproteobacteria bacterium]|nr:TIGR02281 family clan AA aspartic protease [Gammaproteobacteria bacterium]